MRTESTRTETKLCQCANLCSSELNLVVELWSRQAGNSSRFKGSQPERMGRYQNKERGKKEVNVRKEPSMIWILNIYIWRHHTVIVSLCLCLPFQTTCRYSYGWHSVALYWRVPTWRTEYVVTISICHIWASKSCHDKNLNISSLGKQDTCRTMDTRLKIEFYYHLSKFLPCLSSLSASFWGLKFD